MCWPVESTMDAASQFPSGDQLNPPPLVAKGVRLADKLVPVFRGSVIRTTSITQPTVAVSTSGRFRSSSC